MSSYCTISSTMSLTDQIEIVLGTDEESAITGVS